MRTFAAPTPDIISLAIPQSITPGTVTFTVTVDGNFLNSNSQIIFRGQPLATTVLSNNQLQATVPTFFGNPPVQIYNPSIAPNTNDGGYSDTLYFFGATKKNVVVSCQNKSKKYGEDLPVFTSTVTVDGQDPASIGLSLADLGLSAIQYNTPATSTSNAGIYFIRATAPATNDVGLQELYNYTFTDGLLSIEKT